MDKRIPEIKAKVFLKLDSFGFNASLNHRMVLKPMIRGFKVVVLDVVAYYKDQVVAAFYVGSDKPRKLAKYRLTKLKYFKVSDEKEIHNVINEFIKWYTQKYY